VTNFIPIILEMRDRSALQFELLLRFDFGRVMNRRLKSNAERSTASA
jgi:hypothetical protein